MPTPTLTQQLEALAARWEPNIRDAFLAAIQDIVDRAILTDVITAVKAGDPVGAFRALGFTEAALRPITAAIEQAFEQGGMTVAGSFPERLYTPTGRAVFRFDVRDSRAEAWLRDESSTLVTRLTEDAQVAVRNVLTDGATAGRNPRDTALDIVGRVDTQTGRRSGGVVGLDRPSERAVARARQELLNLDDNYFNRERRDKRFDKTVRKAIESGKPLPRDVVEKLINRYSDSLLKLRGERIGRTETIAALNKSEYEAVKQAADRGMLDKNATVRIWDTAGDMRVRHTHRSMDNQRVGLDEAFVTPSGARLMYPGDTSLGAPGSETINCRCRARLKVDWLKGVT